MNRNLFASGTGARAAPLADAVNEAGGAAYALEPRHALAQLASTGTLGNVFYASAEEQLDQVLAVARQCPAEFVAKAAVHAREVGHMKDVPAILAALLFQDPASVSRKLQEAIFRRVCDNGKQVRNFVQVLRSGKLGRRTIPRAARRCVREWLSGLTVRKFLEASIGDKPSLGDVIRMVHPWPDRTTTGVVKDGRAVRIGGALEALGIASRGEQSALYWWAAGERIPKGDLDTPPKEVPGAPWVEVDRRAPRRSWLPKVLQEYQRFREASEHERPRLAVPDVPFKMLQGVKLSAGQRREVALRMGWQALRQELNALARDGAFDLSAQSGIRGGKEFAAAVALKIRDPDAVRKARVFPYQVLMTLKAVTPDVPRAVVEALQDALEVATENVPSFSCRVAVCVDVSGSMASAITGDRGRGATSQVRCVDAAAVIAAAILRRNPEAVVVPFDTQAYDTRVGSGRVEPRDTVATIAEKLASYGGGGTACSVALDKILKDLRPSFPTPDLVVYLSDNQSWADYYRGSATGTAALWQVLKGRNPRARLVLVDLQPYATTQVGEAPDVMNVGGWSDAMFSLVERFTRGETGPGAWVRAIEAVDLGVESEGRR